MSHYREIMIPGPEGLMPYKYVIGEHKIKIVGVGVFDKPHSYLALLPNDVRKLIEANCPVLTALREEQQTWDVPEVKPVKPKKVDLVPKMRGFHLLFGKRLIDIDVTAINEIIIEDDEAARYVISADGDGPLGLPVIRLDRYES